MYGRAGDWIEVRGRGTEERRIGRLFLCMRVNGMCGTVRAYEVKLYEFDGYDAHLGIDQSGFRTRSIGGTKFCTKHERAHNGTE